MSECVEAGMESSGDPLEESDVSKEEYYKSLVTEEEVVAALIKDSKKRDGTLTPERMKPNLNFFQRTVSSLVSKNTKIDHSQDNFKTVYTKENEIELQVLQQIRLENEAKEASRSKKSAIDFKFEKDLFLKTSAINFQKSNETYSTVIENDLNVIKIVCSDKPSISKIKNQKIPSTQKSNETNTNNEIVYSTEPSTSKIDPQLKTRNVCISEAETVIENSKKSTRNNPSVTKEYLKKELEKIHKKIVKASEKQTSSNICGPTNKVVRKPDESKNLSNKKGNKPNFSKEQLLKIELAALNAKIQEKLSKMKKEEETILILDKEENGSDVEIVDLNSSDDDVVVSKPKRKKKASKIKILQNIEITSSTTKAEDIIRNRMLSRMKKDKTEISDNSAFVCTKCGGCNSDVLDKKPCTAIKCETIELSSTSSNDLELVSVKIEPKPKKKKKKLTIKKAIEKDKIKIVLNKTRTFRKNSKSSPEKRKSRDYSSSSNSSRGMSRERSSDLERLDRDRQREDTYKTRKANFKSTVRNRTKSRDTHSRERSTSRERRASFRERDKERSPSRDRRARSFSRFSTGTSYERYLSERNKSKSKSRSRSGSRSRRSRSKDSRQRESSTDSEKERLQAHMLAQQRFEERARREYWMNRIIREYQNRYRIPRIPQRHRLMERRNEEAPAVQSKVVVVPKRERSSSSGSNRSRSRGRKSRSESSDSSSSKGPKQRQSSSEKSFTVNLDKYNLEEVSPKSNTNIVEENIENLPKDTTEKVGEQNVVAENSLNIPEKSLEVLPENTENVICGDISDVSIIVDEKSPKKNVKLDSNNQSREEGELSDQKEANWTLKKKKIKENKKKKKEEKKVKEKDKYVWRQVEISPNVTLHLGTEGENNTYQ